MPPFRRNVHEHVLAQSMRRAFADIIMLEMKEGDFPLTDTVRIAETGFLSENASSSILGQDHRTGQRLGR